MDKWVTDRYPEPNRDILIFDLLQGKTLGFYNLKYNVFINNEGVVMHDVAGWCYVPQDLNTTKTLKSIINSYVPRVQIVKKEDDDK